MIFLKKILDYRAYTFKLKEESKKFSLIDIINKFNEFINFKVYKSFVNKIIGCYQKYVINKEKYIKIPLIKVIKKIFSPRKIFKIT